MTKRKFPGAVNRTAWVASMLAATLGSATVGSISMLGGEGDATTQLASYSEGGPGEQFPDFTPYVGAEKYLEKFKSPSPSETDGAEPTESATSSPTTSAKPTQTNSPTTTSKPTATTKPTQTTKPTATSTAKPTATSKPTSTPTSSTTTPAPTPTSKPTQTESPSAVKHPRFGGNSFWYKKVSSAPVDGNSSGKINMLASSIEDNWLGDAAVNTDKFGVAFYSANSSTPRYDFSYADCQRKGHMPKELAPVLKNVPVPSGAKPAAGGDGHMSIYDSSTDTLWEFWQAKRQGNGWAACWGGKISGVSKAQGNYGGTMGPSATGISLAGGMVSAADVKRGYINHAVCISAIHIRDYRTYSWPAVRSDGNSQDYNSIIQGQRLRLPKSVNVDSLNITPFAKMVAKAAQDYGFIVCDKGGAVAVTTESPDGPKLQSGGNPWPAVFGSVENHALLKDFPWRKMEVIEKDWGKP